jgi:hypothetical protein
MIMRWSYDVRPNAQAADHQFFTDNHLSLNARFQLFDRNAVPIRVLWFCLYDS